MSKFKFLQFRWLITFGVTLLVLWFFLQELSWREIGRTITTVNSSWLLVAALAYVISTLIRAQRLRYVGFADEPFIVLAKITFLQFFYSNLLPWRTGELAFFYLVKKNTSQPLVVAASSLLVTRLFDFIAVVILLIISLVTQFPGFVRSGNPLVLAALGVMILLLIILVMTLFGRGLIVRIAKIFVKLIRIRESFLNAHVFPRWSRFEAELDAVKHRVVALLVSSLIAWVLIGLMTWGMVESLNITVSIPRAVFLTIFPPFAALIPLPTLANFGTIEAGWAFGLSFIGYPVSEAFQIGLSLHVLSLLLYGVGAIIGLIIRPIDQPKLT